MSGVLTKLGSRLGLIACFAVVPALGLLGGSVSMWNWGPGLLVAGLAVLAILFGSSARVSWGGDWHFFGIIGVLGLLGLRAAFSPILPSAAHDLVLVVFALSGYLIGRAQDSAQSRALLLGLWAFVIGDVAVTLVQMDRPEWNPIYPARSGGFPSGFFSHYNHAANFGLGASGIFLSALLRSRGAFRVVAGSGFAASLLMVLFSLSRGGNLTLACIVLIGLVIAAAKRRRRGGGSLLLWSVLVAGGLLVGPVGKVAVERVAAQRGKVTTEGGFADGGRLSFYNAAWKLFLENPLVGGGAGNFGRDVYQVLPADFHLAAEPEMAHNEILQLLADYGGVLAVPLVILLIWPLVRHWHRYLLGKGGGGGVWESLGLLGMLGQSNFDFVFHVAPCVFLAALILGRISRARWVRANDSEWHEEHGIHRSKAEEYYQAGRSAEAAGGDADSYLQAVRSYACAYLAGRERAELRLIVLLLASQEEIWQRYANDLTLREKMRDGKGMAEVMKRIVEECEKGREWRRARLEKKLAGDQPSRPVALTTIFRNLGVVALALFMMVGGIRLSEMLLALWKPLYERGGMSSAQRFESLMGTHEKAPFLGLERRAVAAFVDRLYELQSLEAREFWASSSYERILAASVGIEHDPVIALHIATVAGWAGDEWRAMALYDRAILLQSVHEQIFMARYFKAEYLQDLMLSSAADGKAESSREYAVRAVEEFKRSLELAPYGGVHHQRRQELLEACNQAVAVAAP